MTALKKSINALILATLAMVCVSTAAAQTGYPVRPLGDVVCQVTSAAPLLRAEGLAERIGEIILTCRNDNFTNSGDFESTFEANVQLELPTQVTSNYVDQPDDVIDAVLIINGNHCSEPSAVGDTYESIDGCAIEGAYDEGVQIPQYGVLDPSGTLIDWDGVIVPVPGGPRDVGDVPESDEGRSKYCGNTSDGWDYDNCYPLNTIIRIENVRINAHNLEPDGATVPQSVEAEILVDSPAASARVSLQPDRRPDVGAVLTSLAIDVDGAISGLQCFDKDREDAVTITLYEKFESAFKILGDAKANGFREQENGYYADSNKGGGASQATHFHVTFADIPDGVEIVLPGTVYCSGDTVLELVDDLDLDSGAGTALYEVVEADAGERETCEIVAGVEWEGNIADIGTGTVVAGYYPTSSQNKANLAAPEPRFRQPDDDEMHPFVTTERCSTTLLFPFVTNQAGFDTGIAISNTSEDWLGTTPQDGACTIHYIGERLASQEMVEDQTSTIIEGGDQLVFTISAGAPAQNIDPADGFQGFLIAQCEFQYAHGFAFITDGFGGIPALAQGYLALVIPVSPESGRIAGVPTGIGGEGDDPLHLWGETLGQ